MRRANDYLTFNERVSFCENCSSDVLLHHICENCGFYKGKKIIDGKEDISGNIVDYDATPETEESEAATPDNDSQE